MMIPTVSMLRLPPIGSRVDPLQLRGMAIGDACAQASNNTQAPFELALMSALVAASICLQGRIDVMTPTGVKSPVSLMAFGVAESGERKTAIEKLMLAGVRTWQAQKKQVYKTEWAAWKADHRIWKEREQQLKARLRKALQGDDAAEEEIRVWYQMEPLEPKDPTFLYEDTTLEALLLGMAEGDKHAAMLSDEGGSMLNGYAFRNLAPLNSLWGGASYSSGRKASESFEIVGGRLTTSISIQPGVLDSYLERKGEHGRAIGFWARALMFAPLSRQGGRFEYGSPKHQDLLDLFTTRCGEQLDESRGSGQTERKVVFFEEGVKPVWVALCNAIEAEIRKGGRFEGLNDHASKLAENIARVAAVIYCFENGCDGEIDQRSLELAIAICLQCSDDFAKVFKVVPQEIRDCQALCEWLGQFKNYGRRYVKKNHVLQYGPAGIRKVSRLNVVLTEVVRMGMINIIRVNRSAYLDLFPNYPYDANKFFQDVASDALL